MRELTVRLQFKKHCLGNVKKKFQQSGKKRSVFLFPRDPSGRVVFMPTWWQAVLTRSAEVLNRHQSSVKDVRFSMEVDGRPRTDLYSRYYAQDKFSRHEAFYPGEIIGVTCLVPSGIDDEDFGRIMEIAGKYYGISPYKPNEFGYFEIASIERAGNSRRNLN